MLQKISLNIEGLHKVVYLKNLPFESEGFLVIKTLKNNICTGGLRITPSVDLDEVIELAKSMDLKFSSYDLEVGGAKSGLKIPKKCTDEMRLEILKVFARGIREEIESCYLTGTDLGSTNKDIKVIYDELSLNQMVLSKKILKKTKMKSILFYIPDIILEKIPVGYSKYGGLFTAKGMMLALKILMDLKKTKNEFQSVVVHGVGEVGNNFIKLLKNTDIYIKAICDINQGIVFEIPISSKYLKFAITNAGIIETSLIPKQYKFKKIRPEEVLFEKADILVLASRSKLITKNNFKDLNCNVIVEGANNAIEPDAYILLEEANVEVLPDFYINSAIACSFGLMVMNKVSPYIEYIFFKKTLSFMENKMKDVFRTAINDKRSIRSILLS